MKKYSKYLPLLVILLFAFVFGLSAKQVNAATTVDSGTCGDAVTWTIDSNGTLTISGSGDMENFAIDAAPWKDYRSSIKKLVVNSGVTSIGDFAFCNCTVLTDISLASGITRIGYSALRACPMTTITLPADLTELGEAVFYQCRNLKSITIPSGVTVIEQRDFMDCTSLSSVTLIEGLLRIQQSAFFGCTSLTST